MKNRNILCKDRKEKISSRITQWMPILRPLTFFGMAMVTLFLVIVCHVPMATIAAVFGVMKLLNFK
jgi:hypothetical protein